MKTREDDAVRHLLVADTHDDLLFFTDRGRCFQIKTYELPDATRTARGIPLINLISVDQREWVTAVVRLPKDLAQDYLVMGTKLGEVKKTPLKYFGNVRRGGLNAMDLEPKDELVSVKQASDDDHVLVVTSQGKSLRFSVGKLRSASRQSGGVRGIRLAKGGGMVALEIAKRNEAMLVITSQGFGKRTPVDDYPLQGRGGQGVITFKTTPKTGDVISARMVNATQELMLISVGGIVLRTEVEQISVQGRPTQGVTLMDTEDGDSVAAVTVIDMMGGYKGETSLPTGVSKGPEPLVGGGKERTGKSKPSAGRKSAAGKKASATKAQASKPGRPSAKRSAASPRKAPRKGR
jgi:DNA gyrase subunit A